MMVYVYNSKKEKTEFLIVSALRILDIVLKWRLVPILLIQRLAASYLVA